MSNSGTHNVVKNFRPAKQPLRAHLLPQEEGEERSDVDADSVMEERLNKPGIGGYAT